MARLDNAAGAFGVIRLGEASELHDGLVEPADPQQQIAQAHACTETSRVEVDRPLIFGDGLGGRAFGRCDSAKSTGGFAAGPGVKIPLAGRQFGRPSILGNGRLLVLHLVLQDRPQQAMDRGAVWIEGPGVLP